MTHSDDTGPAAFVRRPGFRIALGVVGLVLFGAMVFVSVADGSWVLAVFFALLALLGLAAVVTALRKR